ncbi:MAG: cytochrome c biogenesis protein CcmH [bacterium]|nr:MAG: cytochrome c biogenesis protein CcmH [bacterium]
MRIKRGFVPIVMVLLVISLPSLAAIDIHQFDSPEKEALYKKLTGELRCTVCQNQSIGESNADLAKDLRRKTYEMVSAGKDEQFVLDFMTQRFGDFILLRPPFQNNTLALWIGPFFILVVAVFFLIKFIRRSVKDIPLTDTDRAQAEHLLERDE